jgi:hypothetical protein
MLLFSFDFFYLEIFKSLVVFIKKIIFIFLFFYFLLFCKMLKKKINFNFFFSNTGIYLFFYWNFLNLFSLINYIYFSDDFLKKIKFLLILNLYKISRFFCKITKILNILDFYLLLLIHILVVSYYSQALKYVIKELFRLWSHWIFFCGLHLQTIFLEFFLLHSIRYFYASKVYMVIFNFLNINNFFVFSIKIEKIYTRFFLVKTRIIKLMYLRDIFFYFLTTYYLNKKTNTNIVMNFKLL